MNHKKQGGINMRPYDLGDIVRVNSLEDNYYLIEHVEAYYNDDFSLVEDADYSLIMLHPKADTLPSEDFCHNELSLVARFDDGDFWELINYFEKERQTKGFFEYPEYMKLIDSLKESEDELIEHFYKLHVDPTKTDKADNESYEDIFEDMMRSDEGGKRVSTYINRMNMHLELLFEAMNKDDEEQVVFQKGKLEEVRQVLMELDYFSLEERRKWSKV